MADIINLRRARKRIERAHRQVAAAENRVRFGRPSAETRQSHAATQRATDFLDAHYLDFADTTRAQSSAKDEPSERDG